MVETKDRKGQERSCHLCKRGLKGKKKEMSPPIIRSRWGHSNGEFLDLSDHYKKGKSRQQVRFNEIKVQG